MTVSNRLWRLMPSDRQSVATSSRCSASAIAVDARAALLGRQLAGDRLDAQLGEGLAKARGDMVGGRDEAAEHDRVGALGDRAA